MASLVSQIEQAVGGFDLGASAGPLGAQLGAVQQAIAGLGQVPGFTQALSGLGAVQAPSLNFGASLGSGLQGLLPAFQGDLGGVVGQLQGDVGRLARPPAHRTRSRTRALAGPHRNPAQPADRRLELWLRAGHGAPCARACPGPLACARSSASGIRRRPEPAAGHRRQGRDRPPAGRPLGAQPAALGARTRGHHAAGLLHGALAAADRRHPRPAGHAAALGGRLRRRCADRTRPDPGQPDGAGAGAHQRPVHGGPGARRCTASRSAGHGRSGLCRRPGHAGHRRAGGRCRGPAGCTGRGAGRPGAAGWPPTPRWPAPMRR